MASRLLIKEPPLQVLPSLAARIGLNEAIILQQVHYWINPKFNKNFKNGKYWVRNTYAQWKEQFPFWGEKTIRRAICKLEDLKILSSVVQTNQFKKTKFYTINYDRLNEQGLNDLCLNEDILNDYKSQISGQNIPIEQIKETDALQNSEGFWEEDCEKTQVSGGSHRPGQNDLSDLPKRADGENLDVEVDMSSFSGHNSAEIFSDSALFEDKISAKIPDLCGSHRSGQSDQTDLPKRADGNGQSDQTHQVKMTRSYNKETETTGQKTTLLLQDDEEEEKRISQEMVEIWNRLRPESYSETRWSDRRHQVLYSVFSQSFNTEMPQWEHYCKKIFENKFLTGETSRGWHASLDWALKEENIEKVLDDFYWYELPPGAIHEIAPEKNALKGFKEELKKHCSQEHFDPAWYGISLELLQKENVACYKSWFMDLTSVKVEGENLILKAPTNFKADYIKQKFSADLRLAAKKIDPRIEEVVVNVQKGGRHD